MPTVSTSRGIDPPAIRRGLGAALTTVALLVAIAGYAAVNGDSRRSTREMSTNSEQASPDPFASQPIGDGSQELPAEFRAIKRAGFDYDPPPIPFGELYPPR